MTDETNDNVYDYGFRTMPLNDPLADLADRTTEDAGAPFEKDTLEALKAARRDNPAKWQRVRADLKSLKVQVSELDRLTAPAASKDEMPTNAVQAKLDPPWHAPVEGQEVAKIINETVRGIVKFQDDEQADAVTLWILSSWLIDRWALFPKCLINSPEKRCGKSTLMEVVEAFVPNPLYVAQISPASMFRIIQAMQPTVMIDESDQTLRDKPDLIGLINAGHRKRQANVLRTQEINGEFVTLEFSVWSPQVIAGIGHMADTIEDRSIRIALRRKLSNEVTDRLRADLFERQRQTRQKIARWAADFPQRFIDEDALPEGLGNDRAQDNWEPLYKVAKGIGGEWPGRARAAYRRLEGRNDDEDLPIPVQLICDIWALFKDRELTDRLTTAEIVADLNAMEERPWSEINYGRPLTQSSMMRRLRKFGLHSVALNTVSGNSRKKHIRQKDVADLFKRYGTPKYQLTDPPERGADHYPDVPF